MEKTLLELNKELINKHKKYIQELGTLNPMILLVKKDDTKNLIALVFKDGNEKERLKARIKDYIIKQDIKAYWFFCDSNMTSLNQKDKNKSKVEEAVITTLYTPKEKLTTIIIHEGKKIIKVIKFTKEDNKNMSSDWDIWGELKIDKKIDKEYQDYKFENWKKYK